MPKQNFYALLPGAPAPPSPNREDFEFQTQNPCLFFFFFFLKLIDFIRELQIETRREGFEMSKKSCKRKKGVGKGVDRQKFSFQLKKRLAGTSETMLNLFTLPAVVVGSLGAL